MLRAALAATLDRVIRRCRIHARVFSLIIAVAAVTAFIAFSDFNYFFGRDRVGAPPIRLAVQGLPVPRLLPCREFPIIVSPDGAMAHTVSDRDLVTVLSGALPILHKPEVSSIIHELKLWGKDAAFSGEMLGWPWTGEQAVEVLLNDALCRRRTASSGGSFLLDSPFGVRVALNGTPDAVARRAEAHLGQLLKALSQAGVPSTKQVTTSTGRMATVADIFQDAVLRFSWDEETKFIGCAIAHWLPPKRSWINQFGEEFTFDDLMLNLIGRPYGEGACMGCHVPYTIALILRVDEQYALLSPSARQVGIEKLSELARFLQGRQCDTGGWDNRWSGVIDVRPQNDDVLNRLTVTGHHLEWIALAPPAVRPPEEIVKRAVLVVRGDIESVLKRPNRWFKDQLPATHAARALCLLRGDDAFARWSEAWRNRQVLIIQKEGG